MVNRRVYTWYRTMRALHDLHVYNGGNPLTSRQTFFAATFLIFGVLCIFLAGFATGSALGATQHQRATASWYGPGLYGNRTANGTRLTPSTWGIAHKSLRFGTRVHICYRTRCVTAPVIDRGPFVSGRTFDLTAAVARSLRFSGVQTVRYQVR